MISAGIVRKAKRNNVDTTHMEMVFFECSSGGGECLHGGQGPAITYRKHDTTICTCMCPTEYQTPRCDLTTGEYIYTPPDDQI